MAKALLGGNVWRNSVVRTSEVAWGLGGYDRAICDAAVRRARMPSRPQDDIYRRAFEDASAAGCGWAVACKRIMAQRGLLRWEHSRDGYVGKDLDGYTQALSFIFARSSEPTLCVEAVRHRSTVPYLSF